FFAGVGAAMVHAGLRVHQNGGKAVPDAPRPDDLDAVAPGVERLDYRVGETSLDLETVGIGAMRPGRLREARATDAPRLDRLLDVQHKVANIGKHLQAALRLTVATGGAERHVRLTLLQDDKGARRRAWPLMGRQDIGVVWIQPEVTPPTVDQDARIPQN